MEWYVQCKFRSENSFTTAWIPVEGAKVGYSMVFEDVGDGVRWQVVEVYKACKKTKQELYSKRSNVFGSIQ